MRRLLAVVCAVSLALGGCASEVGAASGPGSPNPSSAPSVVDAPIPPLTASSPPPAVEVAPPLTRPDWMGTRVLEERQDGFGYAQPTPPELVNRKMPPRPLFVDPPTDEWRASIQAVPDYVLARSTWYEGCPVEPGELRYVLMTYWGFDDTTHMGEMLINASVAEDVVGVFHRLYDARYPIEEMRVWSVEEMEAPPTGDFNITDSYTCRPVATKTAGWSRHAYGLAIDLNPFQNPYVSGDLIVPELAESYTHRGNVRPGMVRHGDLVWQAFRDIGWGWGGDWASLKDYTHFSADGH